MAILDFDASTVERIETNFEPLPAGWYKAIATANPKKGDIVVTKGGKALSLMWVLIDNENGVKSQGRKVFQYINFYRENQDEKGLLTEMIAKAQLAQLCDALNMPGFKDTSELMNKPVYIKLGLKPANGNYDASNDVRGFKSLNGGVTLSDTVVKSASSDNSNKMPWE